MAGCKAGCGDAWAARKTPPTWPRTPSPACSPRAGYWMRANRASPRGLMINWFQRQSLERAYLDALANLPEDLAPPPEQRLMVLETPA